MKLNPINIPRTNGKYFTLQNSDYVYVICTFNLSMYSHIYKYIDL